jgi:hypothetical protein
VTLPPDEVSQKLQATRSYRTEFGPVDEDFGGIASDPNMMRYEVYWNVSHNVRS